MASKLVLENMLSHASTMFFLALKGNIIKHTILGVGQVKVESHMPSVGNLSRASRRIS